MNNLSGSHSNVNMSWRTYNSSTRYSGRAAQRSLPVNSPPQLINVNVQYATWTWILHSSNGVVHCDCHIQWCLVQVVSADCSKNYRRAATHCSCCLQRSTVFLRKCSCINRNCDAGKHEHRHSTDRSGFWITCLQSYSSCDNESYMATSANLRLPCVTKDPIF